MGPSESEYADDHLGYERHHSARNQSHHCHVCVFYSNDKKYCSRSQRNILELIATVQNDPEMRTRSAQLAKKVLKYRNLLQFVDAIDVRDPSFDTALFFGVGWLKVGPATA